MCYWLIYNYICTKIITSFMRIIIQDRFFNDVSYSKYCCPLDVVRGFFSAGWSGGGGRRRRFRSLKLLYRIFGTIRVPDDSSLVSLITYAVVVWCHILIWYTTGFHCLYHSVFSVLGTAVFIRYFFFFWYCLIVWCHICCAVFLYQLSMFGFSKFCTSYLF